MLVGIVAEHFGWSDDGCLQWLAKSSMEPSGRRPGSRLALCGLASLEFGIVRMVEFGGRASGKHISDMLERQFS